MGGKGSGRKHDPERRRQIIALYRAGFNGPANARRLGITHQVVSQHLLAVGIRRSHGQFAPPLTVPQIVRWARAFLTRHGRHPTAHSGPVDGVPGERWLNINQALRRGHRGLPGGSSLSQLLQAQLSMR